MENHKVNHLSDNNKPVENNILNKQEGFNRQQKIRTLMPFLFFFCLIMTIGSFKPSFLSLYILRVLVEESSMIMLLATGLTLVILLGGIDLSIAANASLMTVLLIFWLPRFGWLGLLMGMMVTTGIGFILGYIQIKSQVPSFIVTLGGQALVIGGAMLITTRTIGVKEGYEVVGWMSSRSFGIPHSFLIAIGLILIIFIFMKTTPFGRYISAIGLSESTAIMSGIKVHKIRLIIYTLSGFIAGITGSLLVARSQSGNYNSLNYLLLPSIAAVVIGGTSITGGFGDLGRTIIGVFSISVMRVGIAIIGVDPGYEPLAYGLLIIIAVSLTIDRTRVTIVK